MKHLTSLMWRKWILSLDVKTTHKYCITDLKLSAWLIPVASCCSQWDFLKLILVLKKQKTIREQKYLSWAPVRGTPTAPSLRGYRRSQRNSLPSTLVRVSTGLLQADSGATLAECFFMMMSSDGQSSEPLRLHPWGWFGADTRPLDGTLDVSRAGVLLSVPSHPSNPLFLISLSLYLCRIPPPPSSASLPRSAVSSASWPVSPSRTVWRLLQFANVTQQSAS